MNVHNLAWVLVFIAEVICMFIKLKHGQIESAICLGALACISAAHIKGA